MKQPQLGSILLGTANPDQLRAWYREAFAVTEAENGFLDFGPVGLLIDGRDDVAGANPDPGRHILNFHVTDAKASAAHLDAMGVTWIAKLERRDVGRFATLADPDGNYVQIIELDPEYLAAIGR
jgi:predicted enzyme related to lactoylglutathione lyase